MIYQGVSFAVAATAHSKDRHHCKQISTQSFTKARKTVEKKAKSLYGSLEKFCRLVLCVENCGGLILIWWGHRRRGHCICCCYCCCCYSCWFFLLFIVIGLAKLAKTVVTASFSCPSTETNFKISTSWRGLAVLLVLRWSWYRFSNLIFTIITNCSTEICVFRTCCKFLREPWFLIFDFVFIFFEFY